MLYDFHVHSSNYSPCGNASARDLCERAVKIGLKGIAFTEHDMWWPSEEFLRLRDDFSDLSIFRGIEVSCREGHFLAFMGDSVEEDSCLHPNILELSGEIHSKGGIIIWAHPFRFSGQVDDWIYDIELDGIEVQSSNMGRHEIVLAEKISNKRGYVRFNNSDAHDVETLGRYLNDIPVLLENNGDLLEYVRSR